MLQQLEALQEEKQKQAGKLDRLRELILNHQGPSALDDSTTDLNLSGSVSDADTVDMHFQPPIKAAKRNKARDTWCPSASKRDNLPLQSLGFAPSLASLKSVETMDIVIPLPNQEVHELLVQSGTVGQIKCQPII